MSVELDILRQRSAEPIALAEPRPLVDIPTPALLLDEDKLQANIQRMAEHLAGHAKAPRPHAKTHKCPEIARRQMAAGAVGVCTAKVAEAFVQANAGVTDVLITSPVVTTDRVAALAATLCTGTDLKLVVDSPAGCAVAEAAAQAAERPIGVLLDIDVEMGRTGSRETDRLLQLAETVLESGWLDARGVQHYAGHLMHVERFAERRSRSLASWELALGHLEALEHAGFHAGIVSGAGTGTYDIDVEVAALTDLQVGSYLFMDQEYLAIEPAPGTVPFASALEVQATAISQPRAGLITLDAGYKAMASETVMPELPDWPGARFRFAGDEHAVAILQRGSQEPLLGSKVRMVTPHCDPTVNLYDYYWVHRDGAAHSLWPITGRGCAW